MASKLTVLAVATLVFATNASIYVSDPRTAKDVADAFEEALTEEEPGLKEGEQGMKRRQSMLRTNLRASKVQPVASNSIAEALKPFSESGEASQFEKDVSQLISGLTSGGFAATPFGDGENSPVKKIKDVINIEMMPEVIKAHEANQKALDDLKPPIDDCVQTKGDELAEADKAKKPYTDASPLHKSCRAEEASLYTLNVNCHREWMEAKEVMTLKCKQFAMISDNFGEYIKNQNIMKRSPGDTVDAYINRISSTVCGDLAAGGVGGFLDKFEKAKKECEVSTKKFKGLTTKCKGHDEDWHERREECDLDQDKMDKAACDWNVEIKDACEKYAGCYKQKRGAYDSKEAATKKEESDRKAEWRGLKKMNCIITAFEDGEVKVEEIDFCRYENHTTDHLDIVYPSTKADFNHYDACTYTNLFPTTVEYKAAEFNPLPTLAKGKLGAYLCGGLLEVSTTPLSGSPAGCTCERVSISGPFSPGALVKCSHCTDVTRITEKNSCPSGTKLFAPRSRQDWESFIGSELTVLRDPNGIIDVTRENNGCAGCDDHAMNWGTKEQKSWVTQDTAPWWIRADSYAFSDELNEYQANCFLDILSAANADGITFKADKCDYHSKSYYCQPEYLDLTPKHGSPDGCMCKKVELDGEYSASNLLVKCDKCFDVSKSSQTNSCPEGMKIWSPRTRADWKTFLASATPLRAPHWIIDVTRPENGCGGCTDFAMKSTEAAQATWKTTDSSPWWLRDVSYTQPNGDYEANCYMDLWHTPTTENAVTFDDSNCNYHSRSYYCQPVSTTTTTTTTAVKQMAEYWAELDAVNEKSSQHKQLLFLEAGRLEYLSNYLKARAVVIDDKSSLTGRGSVAELMETAQKWAEEIGTEATNGEKVAKEISDELQRSYDCKKGFADSFDDFTKQRVIGHVQALTTLHSKFKQTFSSMMTFQNLLSPRVEASDLTNYGYALAYFDPANADTPATCKGPAAGKPIVGKSYAECATACDQSEDQCVGFTFFPSKICFLHRSIFTVTSYTGCSDEFLKPDHMRLSCSVKTSAFVAKYPDVQHGNSSRVKWETSSSVCPVYADEGVNFTSPIAVTAAAFKEGTFIINSPGVYELTEDVTFEPETTLTSGVSNNDVMFPDPTSEKYPQLGGYFLGFFAAVVIQADDVTLDCKNKKIEMSLQFNRRQRFFAIIELGSKPFISGAGPPQLANGLLTTAALVSPKNVVIQNCELGLSSHHGIHGNNIEGVTIRNLKIHSFEVGGIHFNGASRVTIEEVQIGPSLKAAYQAFLSQANFIDHLMNSLMPTNPEIYDHRKNAKITLRGTETSVHDVFMKLHTSLHTFYQTHEGDFLSVFRPTNKIGMKGLPDGSAQYGIVIHKTGPAAGDFGGCSLEDAQNAGAMVTDVNIHNVTISDLSVDVFQETRIILAGTQVMGPAGDVFDWQKSSNSEGHYVGTLLSDAQLAVGAFKNHMKEKISNADLTYFFGATNIPDNVLTWAASSGTPWTMPSDGKFSCMGDAMSHVNKGSVGLFLNHIASSSIKNVAISNIENTGTIDALPGECVHADYKGADTRGVAIVNSPGVSLDVVKAQVTVEQLKSTNGKAINYDTIST